MDLVDRDAFPPHSERSWRIAGALLVVLSASLMFAGLVVWFM